MLADLREIFPVTLDRLPGKIVSELKLASPAPDSFPSFLRAIVSARTVRPYLPDLAALELARHRLRCSLPVASVEVAELTVNPSLELLQVGWRNLHDHLAGSGHEPVASEEYLLFWKHPRSGEMRESVATADDLLALKVVLEGHDPLEIAKNNGQPVGRVDRALARAVSKGLLLAPQSRLRRQTSHLKLLREIPEKFLTADAFTLQWHITHRCDLHCLHCYDRSVQADVSLEQGLAVLDQMRDFCRRQHVYGQVSFSGGNPFLHPHFYDLYRAAGERNLNQAVLGNPVSEAQLDRLLGIEKPVFYQVSLEGLEEHNDRIRGEGNFASVLDFLEVLKRKDIYSMVMLTLTQDNMSQVLPLAELLRDRVDLFTYNRLSMVGEGANLQSPEGPAYQHFVRNYLQASQENPVLALKDNLINIERDRLAQGLFGGCTGFGCGAAFNFVSLLPSGQVHACRKFPSPIGDISRHSLTEIYHSASAEAYRRGTSACDECRLRPVCGGCPAVAYGCGLDPLLDKDPGCFIDR